MTESRVTVFVVEDEPGLLEVLSTILAGSGYSIRSASSGDEALKLFLENPKADVLLTDIVMPGRLQGTGLATELRKILPKLPIVFMSGYAPEATVEGTDLRPKAIRLMKPVRKADLLHAIETVVSQAKAKEE